MSIFNYPIPSIHSEKELKIVEQTPLEQHLSGIETTYDILQKAAAIYTNKIALRFVPDLQSLAVAASYTYQSLFEHVTQLANLFIDHGVSQTDVISILLPNIPEVIFALSAAEAVAIASPVSPALSPEDMQAVLSSANSRFLITVPPLRNMLKSTGNIERFERVFVLGEPSGDYAQYSKKSLLYKTELSAKDVCALFHTSGTTGTPKLVQHTHRAKVYSAWAVAAMAHYNEHDVILGGLPYFHVGAPTVAGNAAFAVGAEVVLTSPMGWMDPLLTARFWDVVSTFKITSMTALSFTYREIVTTLPQGLDVSSLRHAISGTPLLPTDYKKIQALTGVAVQEIYGLSEVSCITASTFISNTRHQGSMGVPYPYMKFKVVKLDDNTKTCATNEVGELYVKGPSVTVGYVPASQNQARFIQDGWLKTGDVAYQSSDHYFHYSNRLAFLISRNAPHSVSPMEAENILLGITGIQQAAIVGRSDEQEGEVPIAYVSLYSNSSLTPDDILQSLKTQLTEAAALPVEICILDNLPVNGMGKVLKPVLKALAEIKALAENTVLKPSL